jgi:hypothetical protein
MLVLDQFEELLVNVPATERTSILAQLVTALEESQCLTVAVVVRGDFYAPLAESAAELMPWIERNLVNVPAELYPHELAAIVEGPIRSRGATRAGRSRRPDRH